MKIPSPTRDSLAKGRSTNSLKRVAEGLYLNPNSGNYFAHFRVNGRQVKENLRTEDLKTARRKLIDLRISEEGLDPGSRKETVRTITQRHFELQAGLSRSSITKKRRMAETVFSDWPGGADTLAREVKPSDVERWLLRNTEGLKISTRNEWISFIKGVFERAVMDCVLVTSPAVRLKQERRGAIDRPTPTREEFKRIIENVRKNGANRLCQASADFLEFMGLAGVGNAEASSILVRDVDLKGRKIRLRRQKTDVGFFIPIFPQVSALVERLVVDARSEADARLFPIAEAKKSLASACRQLGVPHFTQRSLRRMFITNAIENGVDVKTIAEWQGHQDGGKLILDTYSHVRRPHHDRMAQLMRADE